MEYTDVNTQNWVKGMLQETTVFVTFTKKDGTERVMAATLNQNAIPADKMPKVSESATNTKSESAQRVFDTEINEWRSFRWDSVKGIEAKVTA